MGHLEQVAAEVFSEERVPYYIGFRDDPNWDSTPIWDDPYIEDVNVEFVVENAQRTESTALRNPHVHATLTILHRTSLTLMAPELGEEFSQRLGLESVHVRFRLLRGNINIKNYLLKDV